MKAGNCDQFALIETDQRCIDHVFYRHDDLRRLSRPRESGLCAVQEHGDGTFAYASFDSGLAKITKPHSGCGVRFLDFDNSGWKDLLIAQGHDLDTVELNYS
jgi:hypothetical protein